MESPPLTGPRRRAGSAVFRDGGGAPPFLPLFPRDAAGEIEACLQSARFAADALVVDSGSGDDTVAIARDNGARVMHRAFAGFGPQKSFAVSQARHDWVLCLDADERVSRSSHRRSPRCSPTGPPKAAGFALSRRNRFLGRWLAHGEGYPDWILRLFDRRRGRWTDDPVHEHVVADGPVERLAGDLCTRRPNRSTSTSRSRTATRRCRRRRCMRAASGRRGAARAVAARAIRSFLRGQGGFLDGAPDLRTSRSARSRAS